jgi:hypothetical protein
MVEEHTLEVPTRLKLETKIQDMENQFYKLQQGSNLHLESSINCQECKFSTYHHDMPF